MELNELKTTWGSINAPAKNVNQLQAMLKENNHPVLKGIRKQLTIEIVGWTAFLACYYTMFDGDTKPLAVNMILVAAVMLALIHNLLGYNFSRFMVQGDNIAQSLQLYLVKAKKYAVVSVVSRVVFLAGLLYFFSYNITFNSAKYMLLAGALTLFVVQVLIMTRIWRERINKLKAAVEGF